MPRLLNRNFRQLFAIDQFKWLFWGNTAMFFGFFATLLLRSLLAWHLTEDELALASVNLVAAVCMFVTSLFAGTLIDRFERKRMLIIAQTVVVSAEALILLLLVSGYLTFGFLLVSAVAASVAFPFIMPARTAMLVEAVGKTRLAGGTSLMTAGVNLARMSSPAMMGIFSDSLGFEFCYCLLLGLHAISLVCTSRLCAYPAPDVTREHFLRETLNGFTYIAQRKSLGWCILFGIIPLMISIPLQNLMVVFVEELWHRGGSGLGIMMAVMGVGGVIGSLSMGMLREGSFVRPMVYSTLVMALFMLLFAHAANFWLAALMVLGVYTASVLAYTLVNTAVQLMSDDYIRGRITTITMMSVSIAPVGTIPLAYATREFGAAWALSVSALLLSACVVLIWWLVRAFRDIDQRANSQVD